jgi:hypothetical protein
MHPQRYRERHADIDALRWTGDSPEMRTAVRRFVTAPIDERNDGLMIKLATTWRTVLAGDWIVCDADGEFSICKPDVFDAMYELVPQPVEELEPPIGRRPPLVIYPSTEGAQP